MRRPPPESGYAWAFRDLLFLLVLAFMALSVVDPPKAQDEQQSPPGQLIVTLGWQHDRDIDVDLWVRGPGDGPVGYSRRTGSVFDLLHDDRGRSVECAGQPAECDDARTEIAVARALPEGEWTVNAVAFKSYDGAYPVAVWITVERLDRETHAATRLFRAAGVLTADHQEITLLNFRTDAHGEVLAGSANDLPHRLWEGDR